MDTAHEPKMGPAEFLAWERTQDVKHEYDAGEVFAMAGASPRHNALCAAIIGELRVASRGTPCRVLTSDQRVSLRSGTKYVYPDVSLLCDPFVGGRGSEDTLHNPSAIVEVLSESTEAHDRGKKWAGYRELASLTDYLMVSQSRVAMEHYQRQDDDAWRLVVVGPGMTITLACGAVLDVDAVYDGVFDLPGDAPPA